MFLFEESMKKSNLIVSGIVVTLVVSYFVYLGVQEAKMEENIFLNRSNVEIDSLAHEGKSIKALRYKSRIFSIEDLPLDIQKRLKNQEHQTTLRWLIRTCPMWQK